MFGVSQATTGAFGDSCTSVCNTVNSVCSDAEQHAHLNEQDSESKFRNLLKSVEGAPGSPGHDPCTEFVEWTTTHAREAPKVSYRPSAPSPVVCFYTSVRVSDCASEAHDNEATETGLGEKRLCYCPPTVRRLEETLPSYGERELRSEGDCGYLAASTVEALSLDAGSTGVLLKDLDRGEMRAGSDAVARLQTGENLHGVKWTGDWCISASSADPGTAHGWPNIIHSVGHPTCAHWYAAKMHQSTSTLAHSTQTWLTMSCPAESPAP